MLVAASVGFHAASDPTTFLGVSNSGIELSSLEVAMSKLVEGGTNLMYAIDKGSSKLLFASVLGVSGSKITDSAGKVTGYTQNDAAGSTNEIIRATATELLRQSTTGKIEVPAANPFLFEGLWVEVRELTEIGSLPLVPPWIFVSTDTACSDKLGSSEYFMVAVGASSATVTAPNSLGECVAVSPLSTQR